MPHTSASRWTCAVGVGNFPISIQTPEEDLDWGIKDWVPYIFDLLMDGDSLSSELLLRYMLNSPSKNQNNPENRYHRIDATLPCYMELDDVSMIPLLVEIGQQVCASLQSLKCDQPDIRSIVSRLHLMHESY